MDPLSLRKLHAPSGLAAITRGSPDKTVLMLGATPKKRGAGDSVARAVPRISSASYCLAQTITAFTPSQLAPVVPSICKTLLPPAQ